MDYEKKYNEALNTAKMWYKNTAMPDNVKEIMRRIFPELQESGDEKIRKELIEHIKANKEVDFVLFKKFSPDEVLAWLEKQRKQKSDLVDIDKACEWLKENVEFYSFPKYQGEDLTDETYISDTLFNDFREAMKEEKVENANKVEPKFKVGDWIVCNETLVKIVDCDNNRYTVVTTEGLRWSALIGTVDREFHKWTIADAKAGDVLTTVGDEYSFIYKGCLDPKHPNSPVAYCGLDLKGELCVNSRKSNHWWTDTTVHPATKAQCVLLFSKMHEAGYEWDEKKLELKKITSGNTEQDDRCLGWLKKDADMLDFLMALFEDTFPDMTFRPLAHMDRKEPITSKDIVNWLDNLRPIIDYTYVWFDAAKELPPKRKGLDVSEYVLVYALGDVYKSAYDYGNKCWMYNNHNVTHWAYLLKPPKTE